jgi:sec-independent protein translocase protein TatA
MPGPMELMIIGGIMLLLFGSRLPSVMRSLGQSITEFKKGVKEIGEPLEEVREQTREINRELRK